MRYFALCGALALLANSLLANAVSAQRDTLPQKVLFAIEQKKPPTASSESSFERYLFPPDLVMQHGRTIGLKPEQRTAIRASILQLQTRALELQWALQDHAEKLIGLLERPSVNESEVLAQIDQVLATERDVKRAQMSMLIKIKNTLTADQQHMLRRLRCGAPAAPDLATLPSGC